MRLPTLVNIKCGKPFVPLFLGRLSFFKITDNWVVKTREETVIDDRIVAPAIDGSRDVVIGLSFQSSSILQIKFVSLNVLKFKGVLFKDTSDTTRLHPKKSRKEEMKRSTGDANQ